MLVLLLTFAGVIGGLLSFGLMGIFVGPVILAVACTLLQAWVGDADVAAPDGARLKARRQRFTGR